MDNYDNVSSLVWRTAHPTSSRFSSVSVRGLRHNSCRPLFLVWRRSPSGPVVVSLRTFAFDTDIAFDVPIFPLFPNARSALGQGFPCFLRNGGRPVLVFARLGIRRRLRLLSRTVAKVRKGLLAVLFGRITLRAVAIVGEGNVLSLRTVGSGYLGGGGGLWRMGDSRCVVVGRVDAYAFSIANRGRVSVVFAATYPSQRLGVRSYSFPRVPHRAHVAFFRPQLLFDDLLDFARYPRFM